MSSALKDQQLVCLNWEINKLVHLLSLWITLPWMIVKYTCGSKGIQCTVAVRVPGFGEVVGSLAVRCHLLRASHLLYLVEQFKKSPRYAASILGLKWRFPQSKVAEAKTSALPQSTRGSRERQRTVLKKLTVMLAVSFCTHPRIL